MTHDNGTFGPQYAAPTASAPPAKAGSAYTVTLRSSPYIPLFRTVSRARSPQEAISQADPACSASIAAIGEQFDLSGVTDVLVPNAAQTSIVRCWSQETYRISEYVRSAGQWRKDDAKLALTEVQAIALLLLNEVVDADRQTFAALNAGETIDICPAYVAPRATYWVTIDCIFRARDATGEQRKVSLACPALRMAVCLIVIRWLSQHQMLVRKPLAQRWKAATIALPSSATLRAARRLRGLVRPHTLIAWLRVHGHAAVADALDGKAW